MPKARRRGMILILSSPSGAGKTTLTRMLMQDKALDLTLSVSVTTRPRRSSEVDGIHYRFIDRREFERMKKGGELLEWAEVHGNGYGTPRALVERVLAEGRDMLFDVDWQGARQVRERLGDDVVSIFVLPPSMRELRAQTRAPRRGFLRDDRPAARGRPARDRALARLPICDRQRRPAAGLRRRAGDRQCRAAQGVAGRGRRRGVRRQPRPRLKGAPWQQRRNRESRAVCPIPCGHAAKRRWIPKACAGVSLRGGTGKKMRRSGNEVPWFAGKQGKPG